jgi:hypothetical protein
MTYSADHTYMWWLLRLSAKISSKSHVIFVHHNSTIMKTVACISSTPHVMVVRPRLILPKLGMVGLIPKGPQLDGQVTLASRRWYHKSRECVKFVRLDQHGSTTRGVEVPVFACLENDGKFVYVIVLYLNFFNVGVHLVRHECLFWNKVLVCTTFVIDTIVVVSSADSWWPFLPTGHIYQDVTVFHNLNW